MKKIILISSGFFAVLVGYGQTGKSNSSGTVVNSGIVDPTINGIPYSQYKAQVEAQMNQQKANNTVTVVKPVNPDGNNAQNKSTNVNPAQNAGFKSVAENNKVQPQQDVNNTVIQGGAVNSSGNKQTTTSQDPSLKQSPANNTKVEDKPQFQGGSNGMQGNSSADQKTKVVTETPVTTTQPVEEKKAEQSPVQVQVKSKPGQGN